MSAPMIARFKGATFYEATRRLPVESKSPSELPSFPTLMTTSGNSTTSRKTIPNLTTWRRSNPTNLSYTLKLALSNCKQRVKCFGRKGRHQ